MVERRARGVVVGAGIAGLAAAAALRPYFDEVVVVERDADAARGVLADAGRPGVPQGCQLHNILGRAQSALDHLLPGFSEALVAAGGRRGRVTDETHVFELGRVMPERDLGWYLMAATRPTVERVLRALVDVSGGVTYRAGRAVGLRRDGDRVTAVDITTPDGPLTLDAALVVDATGASTRATDWLRSIDWAPPTADVRRRGRWYTTAVFQRPMRCHGRDDFWLVFPTGPGTRAGLVSPEGETAWRVSISGDPGDPAPRTATDVVSFARTLDHPMIADLLADATPIAPPVLFRRPSAWWLRYDEADSLLIGFLPIGDAMATLDPLRGQGISVAAWQADSLFGILDCSDGDLAEVTRTYIGAATHAARTAWDLEPTSESVPAVVGGDDAAAHVRYVRAWHLLDPLPLSSQAVS